MTVSEWIVFAMIPWVTFVSWQLRSLAAQLAEQAQVIARIAANANEGAQYVADHQHRIERLERFTVLVGSPLVDDEN